MPAKYQRKNRTKGGGSNEFSSKEKYLNFRSSLAVDLKSLQRGSRRKRLKEVKSLVEWAINYISDNKLDSNILGSTRRIEILYLENLKSQLEEDIETVREQLQLERQFAFENKNKPKMGTRGDGKTYLNFINMGLGDCTTITSPSGRLFLMDCGSTGMSDVDPRGNDTPSENKKLRAKRLKGIVSALNSSRFLGGNHDTLDGLFLSHVDADHHNLIRAMFKEMVSKVGVVYFGGAEDLANYAKGGASTSIRARVGKNNIDARVKSVIVREEWEGDPDELKIMLNGYEVTDDKPTYGQLGKEFIDKSTGELVVYTEQDKNKNEVFRLSILASNVKGAYDTDDDDDWVWVTSESGLYTSSSRATSTATNIGSLVLKVWTPSDIILICSDATALTERSMVNHFKNSLKEVTVLRVPHHASNTSSSKVFVNSLAAIKGAVVSGPGQFTTKHHLPKKLILDLYYNVLDTNQIDAHDLWSWDKDDSKAQVYHSQITEKLFVTGSGGSVSYEI